MHFTYAEETGLVRPAVDSVDNGVYFPRKRVRPVKLRPAGRYLADYLSNSVQITLTKPVIKPGSDQAMCFAVPTSIHDEISSVSNLGFKFADGTNVALSLGFVDNEAVQNFTPIDGAEPPTHFSAADSALEASVGTWLLVFAVVSVTTLYTICNPNWVPSFVAQTVKISKQLSASTPLGDMAVTNTAKAGAGAVAVQPTGETAIDGLTRNSVVRGARPAAPASLRDVDRLAAHHDGSSSGGHRILASDRDETGTRENLRRHSQFPATEIQKAAETRTSKSKIGFLVPPPPPTPCVLPPEFGFFPMQPAQQYYAAPQQQLQQAQVQPSPKTYNQTAAQENTPQSTAASGRTEATQSAALVAADQELQAADQELQGALRSSLRTVGEWTH